MPVSIDTSNAALASRYDEIPYEALPHQASHPARLATDATFMGRVRAAIRAGLANSTLTDMPRHTRALEAAYETALSLRCSPAPPTPLPSAPQMPGTQAP